MHLHKHGAKGDVEELHAAPRVHLLTGSGDDACFVRVETLVQRQSTHAAGPDAVTRVDEECATETRKTVSAQLATHCVEKLVRKVHGKALVEPLGKCLHKDDTGSVGNGDTGVAWNQWLREVVDLLMMVISMCSFLLKGPGLVDKRRPKTVKVQFGRDLSSSFPRGTKVSE